MVTIETVHRCTTEAGCYAVETSPGVSAKRLLVSRALTGGAVLVVSHVVYCTGGTTITLLKDSRFRHVYVGDVTCAGDKRSTVTV